MPRNPNRILQRFAIPKTIKGNRATTITVALRKLIKSGELKGRHQFLAIHLLAYLEGMVDRMPRLFEQGERDVESNYSIDPHEIDTGLDALFETFKAEKVS